MLVGRADLGERDNYGYRGCLLSWFEYVLHPVVRLDDLLRRRLRERTADRPVWFPPVGCPCAAHQAVLDGDLQHEVAARAGLLKSLDPSWCSELSTADSRGPSSTT